MYQVKFIGSKVTELTANFIAKSIYAPWNECLLLKALINHHKDNKAIPLTEQQTSVWNRQVTYMTT